MRLHAEINDPDDRLTAREQTVLVLLCQGLSRKQMAGRLHRSAKTLEKHIDQLHKKLTTHNAHATVATAVAEGLVTISKLCMIYALCLGAVDLNTEARRPPARTVRVVSIARVGAGRGVGVLT